MASPKGAKNKVPPVNSNSRSDMQDPGTSALLGQRCKDDCPRDRDIGTCKADCQFVCPPEPGATPSDG